MDLSFIPLPDGWEIEEGYGMDFLFICPCGNTIEQDGRCPECGPSPMVAMGMI